MPVKHKKKNAEHYTPIRTFFGNKHHKSTSLNYKQVDKKALLLANKVEHIG